MSDSTLSASRTGPEPYPAASDGRTRALVLRLRTTGDRRLRDQLVTRHLGLVRQLVRRFVDRGVELAELKAVATRALQQAIDGFDPAAGRPFVEFAVPSIVGQLERSAPEAGVPA